MTIATAAPKTSAAWQIDAAHSSIDFSVRHLMISTVRGRFGDFSGTANGLDGATGGPSLEVVVEVASIDTGIAPRDEHLRSADFFDVAEFPQMTFRATRTEGSLAGSFQLFGDLTIRGVTREVSLEVQSQGQTVDPWGKQRAGFSATGKLTRSDFGLTYNQILETGGLAISDEIVFSVDVALTRDLT